MSYSKKLLVFDLDGTLIDSAKDISSAVNRTLKKYKSIELPEELIRRHIGEGLRSLVFDFFKEEKAQDPEKYEWIENDFLKIYEEEMYNHTKVYPGVRDFLFENSIPRAILTNKNELLAKKVLHHLDLMDFGWVRIVGGDTYPEKKPSALPLKEIYSALGLNSEDVVMIGDGIPDVGVAQSCGIHCFGVSYGYTDSQKLRALGAHEIIDHIHELDDLLIPPPKK